MLGDVQRTKLHIAAQLLLQGFDEQLVTGGFTDEELEKAKVIAEELRHKHSDSVRPPAAELSTAAWLVRRIKLRITRIPSKQLAAHAREQEHNAQEAA